MLSIPNSTPNRTIAADMSSLICRFMSLATILSVNLGTTLASELYSHDSPWLLRYDFSQSLWTKVGSSNLNTSIEDLTFRKGERTNLYALENSRSNGKSISRLVKINRLSGRQSNMPFTIEDSALGLTEIFSTGIAISPLHPSIAIVIGFDAASASPTFGQNYLWRLDADTGMVLSSPIPISKTGSPLTFDPAGSVLYSADNEGRLITLDELSGAVSVVGDPMLSNFIEGLAFRPEDRALYAIDGFTADQLVVIDPLDGKLLNTVGSMSFGGTHGLVFVPEIPEPASAVLLLLAMASMSLHSRRRAPGHH